MILVNHEAEVLYTWNMFSFKSTNEREYKCFGYGSAFLVNNLSFLIQLPASNFLCEILIVRLTITTRRWRPHSDGISTLLPLNILTTLLWLCPCTIKYDSESYPSPCRGPVYCIMSQFALISPPVPATVNLSAKVTFLRLCFLNKLNSLGKCIDGIFLRV